MNALPFSGVRQSASQECSLHVVETNTRDAIKCADRTVAYLAIGAEAYGPLLAAAPDLVDGINALLGLIDLVCRRDDMPESIARALLSSHRACEARAALAKAGVP